MNTGKETGKERLQADVLINGGGLAGLTLAIAFADAGLKVAVIDRDDPAATLDAGFDGRVSAIAYASVQLFEATGVWKHVKESQPILDIRVSDGDSLMFLHYDHRDLGEGPFGHMVENRVLRWALQDRAAELDNLTLLAPTTLESIERGAERVTARTASGVEITAALCVAADGRRSRLREEAGIKTVGWNYNQVGIVCTVEHELPHHGVAQERFLPSGPFAILPMTGNRSSLVWTERANLAPAFMALDDAAFEEEMAVRFGDFLGDLKVAGPRWSYPLALHQSERYIDQRLALVGDAAHGMHPIAGQGLNLGLRDVAALAEVVVDAARLGLDIGRPEVLDRYQRWRRFDSLMLLAVTDVLNRLFSNDIAPLKLVRDLGLAAVNRLPNLKKLFMRHARGTVGDLPRLLRGARL